MTGTYVIDEIDEKQVGNKCKEPNYEKLWIPHENRYEERNDDNRGNRHRENDLIGMIGVDRFGHR